MMTLFSCRSIRSRPGSLKTKNQYQKLRENGNVGAMTTEHKMDDFDIKILQQKRHEAEVKRYVETQHVLPLTGSILPAYNLFFLSLQRFSLTEQYH